MVGCLLCLPLGFESLLCACSCTVLLVLLFCTDPACGIDCYACCLFTSTARRWACCLAGAMGLPCKPFRCVARISQVLLWDHNSGRSRPAPRAQSHLSAWVKLHSKCVCKTAVCEHGELSVVVCVVVGVAVCVITFSALTTCQGSLPAHLSVLSWGCLLVCCCLRVWSSAVACCVVMG